LNIKLVRIFFYQQTLILKADRKIPDGVVTKMISLWFSWGFSWNLFVEIKEDKSSVKIGGIFIDFRVSKTRTDLSLTWKFHILIKRIKARFQIAN